MKPTNGELKIMLDNLIKDSNEKHAEFKEILNEIRIDGKETKAQAIKTNGRVNILEVERKTEQRLLKWGLGVLWGIFIAAIPIIWLLVTHEIEKAVNRSVTSILSDYNFQFK